nr:retrovirus-related Pol polyprotein from transposon TNT 1-94 [Tanacetum cinerariifolium]
MSQEIMHIVVNSVDILDVKKSYVNDCNKCLELETELFKKKDFMEKEAYDKLIKRLKKNRDAHEVYIEKTIEYADTLCGFVKRARTQTDNGTEFVNQTLRKFYENVGTSHKTSVARTPQQNDIVEQRNRTLVEAARTMLIFSTAPLFFWVEAINKACYTQNRSLIRLRYNKTPYELMHDKKLDLSFFYVFGSLYYPTNDSEDLGKLNATTDIVPVVIAPRAVEIADSPVSMSIDQDAPSSSIPSTQDQEYSLIISQGVEESPKTPLFYDDPLYEFLHEDSTSQGSSYNVRPSHTSFELIGRWTKDHLIVTVIGDPSHSVSTRKRSNRRRVPNIVEPEIRTIEEIVLMADRTMEELL